MTIEQEIKLQVEARTNERAKELAKDIAKDMAQDIANKKTLETAKNLLKINISPEQIAMATGLSLEQVKNLETGEI